jgi:UDP-N-acetylmuramoylalanine--D-glutamate ligase
VINKKKAFVLGLARSGFEAAKLLASQGYDVIINDAKNEANTEMLRELHSLGIKVVLGAHPENLFDDSFEMIVKNPGISNNHKYVKKAQEINVPVINEIELALRYFPKGVTTIGITGTNGKTTTTIVVYEILKKALKSVFLMGNMGYPACSFIPFLKDGDIAVMEVSDHQLCNVINFKTNISVLTNLSEAHLDFHGSYEIYKNMKKRIFNHHTKEDLAILNLDNKDVLELTKDIESNKKYFSTSSANKASCSIVDGYICYNNNKIIALDEVRIKGNHNYENIAAAIAVVKELGVEDSTIISVLKTFSGVEHRLEYVKTINDIDFYNDSKATNIVSTQKALSSIKKPTVLLLGGLDRGQDFSELKDYLANVKLIAAYGEAKSRINDFAVKCGIACKIVDTLEEATEYAFNSSHAGGIVLLSPACASWDQFEDFEVRGNMFKKYINNL